MDLNDMQISIDEAIQRLKAEIMAQDWQLSRRRSERLHVAFAVLDKAVAGRRGYDYILGMARGTLEYLDRHGRVARPEALDFLKESLAHLVTIVEDRELTGAREAEIFHRAYARFKTLKKNIAEAKGF
jgi:hypothetical protein